MGRALLLLLLCRGLAFAGGEDDDPEQLLAQARQAASDGRLREAALAYRAAATLRPRDLEAHLGLSTILMRDGQGEAARAEARRAVALAPASARTHVQLAWTLEYDAFGRSYYPGFDWAGATAEYRKAKALDPHDASPREGLARLLLRNSDGDIETDPARLAPALAEQQALYKDFPTADHGEQLVVTLIRTRRFAEALRVAHMLPSSSKWRTTLILGAAAVSGGVVAVRREASAMGLSDEARNQALAMAGRGLAEQRLYPIATRLLNDAGEGPRADFIRNARRREDIPPPAHPAEAIVQRFFLTALTAPDVDAAARPMLSRELSQRLTAVQPSALMVLFDQLRAPVRQRNVPRTVAADVLAAKLHFTADGDDAAGWWRVRVGGMFSSAAGPVFYVKREEGGPRVVGLADPVWTLAGEVLALTAAGDLPNARRLLDWLAEDAPAASPSTFGPRPFTLLWRRGDAGDREAIERAAASLLVEGPGSTEAVATLSRCGRPECDPALALGYRGLRRWRDLGAVAERIAAREPASRLAFHLRAAALEHLARAPDLRRLAEQWLHDHPGDTDAQRVLQRSWLAAGDYAGYERELRDWIDHGTPEPSDYNNLAWWALFHRAATPADVDLARKAADLTHRRRRNILHTLATLFAETGDVRAAYETLIESMAVGGADQPREADFYVLGRIAEQVGLRNEAIADYRRLPAPPTGELPGDSTSELARRRLAALGAR